MKVKCLIVVLIANIAGFVAGSAAYHHYAMKAVNYCYDQNMGYQGLVFVEDYLECLEKVIP